MNTMTEAQGGMIKDKNYFFKDKNSNYFNSRYSSRRYDSRSRSRSRDRKYRESYRKRRRSPVPVIDFLNKPRKTGWDKTESTMSSFIPINLISAADGKIAANNSISGTLAALSSSNLINPHAQAKQQKKLYVGNLPHNITSTELVDFLNSIMEKSRIYSTDGSGNLPVVSAKLRPEQAYAFVEFRTAKDATIGMKFDGVDFKGQALRVRRPKDYIQTEEDEIDIDISPHSLNIVSTNVEDTPDKIFIGGLPSNFNEQEVKELLSMFGPLKSFNLVRDSVTGVSKSYAFCEYLDPSVTDKACETLNGMSVQDKTLVVQRANTNAKPQPQPVEPVDDDKHSLANTILNFSIPIANIFSTIATIANNVSSESLKPTKTLIILNAIDITVPFDDESYQNLMDDIEEECSNYGKIVSIRIPKVEEIVVEDSNGEARYIERDLDFGKIFVEYETVEASELAQKELSGRRYNGRMVITSFHHEEKENEYKEDQENKVDEENKEDKENKIDEEK